MHSSLRHSFAILSIVTCAACSSADDPAVDSAPIRVGNLVVNAEDLDVCWTAEGAAPESVGARLNGASLAYPAMTNYLSLPLADNIRVKLVERGQSCDSAALAEATVDRRDLGDNPQFRTLVLLGDEDDGIAGFEAVLLADETDITPTSGAKGRVFHADPEAPTLDAGVHPPGADRIVLFEEMAYGQTAQGSAVGEVSSRGYVEGIPTVPFPVMVWQADNDMPLLRFDDAPPFEAGLVNSVFPAGKVLSGQAEAFMCVDDTRTVADAPLASCLLVIPTVL